MRRGVTIVELLIVMVLLLVVGVGLFTLYTRLVRFRAEQSSMVRNEAQLQFVIDNLAKLISSAGFGIDRDGLLLGNNGVVHIGSSANIPQSMLTILTRAATQDATAGCWGIIDQNGNFILRVNQNDIRPASSTTFRECPNDPAQYPIRISMSDKTANCQRNCLAFVISPERVELRLDTQNLQRFCLNGTRRLMLDMDGPAGEVIPCVGHLRFRYLVRGNNGTTVAQDNPPTSINDLMGVRLCMMVQLSDTPPATTEFAEPQYTERCSTNQELTTNANRLTSYNPNLTNTWRLRRWIVVEQDIFMPNLR